MGKPAAVIRVSLEAAPILYIIGIRQHDFDTCLQNVKDRFPIRACAFHQGVAAAFLDEPIAKKLQLPDDRSEFSNLYLRLGLQRSRHDTNNQKLLADVDPGATLDDCLNHFLSLRMSSQRKKDQVVPRAQRLQSEVRRRWPDQINVRGLATITVAILAHPQTHFHPPRWPRIGRPWGH